MTKDGLSPLLDKTMEVLKEAKRLEEEKVQKLDDEDDFVYIKYEDKDEDDLYIENPTPGT